MSGPQWNIESEYPSLESEEYKKDLAWCESEIEKIKDRTVEGNEIELFLQFFEINSILHNLRAYCYAVKSVDTSNSIATKMSAHIQSLYMQIEALEVPIKSWFQKLNDEQFTAAIKDSRLDPFQFSLKQRRKIKNILLPEAEEKMAALLQQPGYLAWANLYNQISGAARIHADIDGVEKEYSLSELDSLQRSSDESTRKKAWTSIQSIWKIHEQASAAILNGIADWRMQLNTIRSQVSHQAIDHLFYPLYLNRIDQPTLEVMLGACEKALPQSRLALKQMAKALKKSTLDPWDLLAGFPSSDDSAEKLFDFPEAIELISSALNNISSEFGEFVHFMVNKNWIEGRVLPTKAPGGYCTSFLKSKTPRIFMSYRGSASDVMTLAHEFGHAYHHWVTRDLHLAQAQYPMNLAETASIFFETIVRDQLILKAKSQNEKNKILWSELQSAASFLINVPARFEFEHQFNLYKNKSGLVTAQELCKINKEAWEKWYGDGLKQMDERYWSSKLHFSMSHPFYNFPYTFGYLFSLSIYAQKEKWGEEFLPKYKALLRDTGQMMPEEISRKYLGQSLTDEKFWRDSMAPILEKIENTNFAFV